MTHLHFLPPEKFCRLCFNSRLPRLLSRLIRAFRARIRIHIAACGVLAIYICAEICILIIVLRELVGALIERVSAAAAANAATERVSRGLLSE